MPTSTVHNANQSSARRDVPSIPTNGSLQPVRDIVSYVREYARQKPDVAALWCFGLGIVVGWKAKPW